MLKRRKLDLANYQTTQFQWHKKNLKINRLFCYKTKCTHHKANLRRRTNVISTNVTIPGNNVQLFIYKNLWIIFTYFSKECRDYKNISTYSHFLIKCSKPGCWNICTYSRFLMNCFTRSNDDDLSSTICELYFATNILILLISGVCCCVSWIIYPDKGNDNHKQLRINRIMRISYNF